MAKATFEQIRDRLEFELAHPNYCRGCGGYGLVVAYDYGPEPDAPWQEICPDCLEKFLCPHCGHRTEGDVFGGDLHCPACGWDDVGDAPQRPEEIEGKHFWW